jgi:hypothetical protein
VLGAGRTGPSAGLRTRLALHQKLAAATVATDKQLYQHQIQAIDRQIDALVYELMGWRRRKSRSSRMQPGDRRVENSSIRLATRRGDVVHLGFSGRKSPHNYGWAAALNPISMIVVLGSKKPSPSRTGGFPLPFAGEEGLREKVSFEAERISG